MYNCLIKVNECSNDSGYLMSYMCILIARHCHCSEADINYCHIHDYYTNILLLVVAARSAYRFSSYNDGDVAFRLIIIDN